MAGSLNFSSENLKKIIAEIGLKLKNQEIINFDIFKQILNKYPKRYNVIDLETLRKELKTKLPERYDYWMKQEPIFEKITVKYRTHRDLINAILDKMVQIVMANYDDTLIHYAAKIILGYSDKTTEQNDLKEIYTLLAFLRQNIRYTRDILDIETLIQPQIVLLKHPSMDCDDFAMTLASLLRTIGYKVRFKAIKSPGAKQIHHVYVEVFSPQQRKWIALDGILKRKSLDFEPAYADLIIREIK